LDIGRSFELYRNPKHRGGYSFFEALWRAEALWAARLAELTDKGEPTP